MQSVHQNALFFSSRGFPITPLNPNSKTPILTGWPRRPLNDLGAVDQWFQDHPNSNYGILTGEGFVVLDVDNKNGHEGSRLLAGLREIPETLTVATPNQGFHYYYRTNESLNSGNWNNGLELKSHGAYVVGPGSILNDRPYEVINDVEMAEFPYGLIELLDKKSVPPVYEGEWEASESLALTEEQGAKLEGLLNRINPDLGYDAWLKATYAALNVFGFNPDVIEILREWSSQGGKYEEGEFNKKIESYDPQHVSKVGFPTLEQLAWEFPHRVAVLPSNQFGNELKDKVLKRVLAILERHGNKPSEVHRRGLATMCDTLANGMDHRENFRIAFPLETGMGKTSCVVALATELQGANKGLLICAEQIEQLGEMKASMIAEGVEADRIGIYHKSPDKHPEVESVAFDDMPKYQYLLVSHNRVKTDSVRSDVEQLLRYGTGERCLTVWDESLISTNADFCHLAEVERAAQDWLNGYRQKIRDGKKSPKHDMAYQEFSEFLAEVIDLANVPLDEHGSVVSLPPLSEHKSVYEQIINNISGGHDRYTKALNSLVSFGSLGEVRLLKVQDGPVIMQFVQVIDDKFGKVVVMDASSRIRHLITFDDTMDMYPLPITKDYSDVTIYHSDVRGSKHSFEEDRNHIRNYIKEMDSILEGIPVNKDVIVFCHKSLKDELLKWKGGTHPFRTIHILNWGEHRASNKYSHAEYVFTCGIVYRDRKEIASSIVAQTRNLKYRLFDHDVHKTYYSEQADMLYQGFSRGNCRNTSDGKAGMQTIYMFHPEKDYGYVMESLRLVMPGVQEKSYFPKYLSQGRKDSKNHQDLAREICNNLANLPLETDKVSKMDIRKQVAPEGMTSNSKTWRRAMELAASQLEGWRLSERMAIRI